MQIIKYTFKRKKSFKLQITKNGERYLLLQTFDWQQKKSEKNTQQKKRMFVSLALGFQMFSSFTKQIDFEMRS